LWVVRIKKSKKKFFNQKRLIIVSVIYLIIGFYFTILRSSSHYKTFVIDEDPILENNISYWDNRCVPENKNNAYGTPGAIWCIDGLGKFQTRKPSKFSWYLFYYGSHKGAFLATVIFWPLHLIGFDMIHFRSMGGLWRFG